MKTKNIIRNLLLIALTGCSTSKLLAQQGTNTGGTEAKGDGGAASITVGQVDYISLKGAGGTISQGVQQAYSIEVLQGIEVAAINLSATVYPNPSSDFVMLSIDNMKLLDMSYAVYDFEGKLLGKQTITEDITKINLITFNKGIYLIKISEKNNEVKTFKIVKN